MAGKPINNSEVQTNQFQAAILAAWLKVPDNLRRLRHCLLESVSELFCVSLTGGGCGGRVEIYSSSNTKMTLG